MLYTEDVGGPGQATTAQYLTDFFTTVLLNHHRGHFALIISRQYFLHGIGISRERFRYIAVTVLPKDSLIERRPLQNVFFLTINVPDVYMGRCKVVLRGDYP
jgi:hypothetical protein